MKPPISFWVSGEPKGQPRPRAFARKFGDKWQARVYDSNTAEGWKGKIATAYQEAWPAEQKPLDGPVFLSITFYIKRPKSHYLKSGLRSNAPSFCQSKPDVDNYAKAVMDALTQLGAWNDDSQVVWLKSAKMYCNTSTPGAQIEIKEKCE